MMATEQLVTVLIVPVLRALADTSVLWLRPDVRLECPLSIADSDDVVAVVVPEGGPTDSRTLMVFDVARAAPVLDGLLGRLENGDELGVVLAELPARHSDVGVLRGVHSVLSSDALQQGGPWRAAFDTTADGTPLDSNMRRLFAAGRDAGALLDSPFGASGWEAFRRYLVEPSDNPADGGISRLLAAIYSDRPDLQRLYVNLRDATDRRGFLGWAAAHGSQEGLVPEWAVPAVSDLACGAAPDADAVGLGVNVAGYFQSELGVGEAARRIVDALDAAQVPLLTVQGPTQPPSRRGHDAGSTSTEAASFPINLICVNADGLPRFLREAGPGFAAGRTTVGLWWWELPDFPEEYRSAFGLVDEVWVGSRYVQDALAPVSPVPVVRVPVPVVVPSPPRRTRAELGLPEGFLVLFAFDHNSVMERKNPLGLIEAFSRAFTPRDGAQLVIKSINAARNPGPHRQLLDAAASRDDITVLDGYFSARDRDAMIAACDVYASLHRAEGFGLTLAEAMSLGRPVVATNWSGNVDFMSAETAWPVPCTTTAVGNGCAPYAEGSRWAEPDLGAAAAALREIRADPEAAAARAAAGAAWIAEHHAPAVAGAAMRARLEVLHPRALERAAFHAADIHQPARSALAAARARVARSPEEFAPRTSSALTAAVRRVILKATRANAMNQTAADEAVLVAVEQAIEQSEAAVRNAAADRRAVAQLSATTQARQRSIERRLQALER